MTEADAGGLVDQRRRRRRRRRLWFVLVAAALGLSLALGLLELGFRMFWTLPPWFAEIRQAGMYVPADDDATPVLRPGYTGTLELDEGAVTEVRINRLGMRGDEVPPKAAGDVRVLVLGDSMVFGYGVEHDAALPARLQQGLRERGVNATCGNAGVPGFGMQRAARQMARLDEPFAADAFVVCSCLGNDALDDSNPRTILYAGLQFHGVMAQHIESSWRMRLAMRSRAALWFENWIFVNHRSWSPLSDPLPSPGELALQAGFPPAHQRGACLFLDVRDREMAWQAGAAPVVPRVMETLRAALDRVAAQAGDRPVVFVLLPTLYHVDAAEWREKLAALGLSPEHFELGLQQRRMLEVAASVGIDAFDASEVVGRQATPEQLYVGDKGHLSVRGNEIVGNWLAERVVGRLR